MRAVRPDHQVEGPDGAVGEGDLDAVGVLGEGRHPQAEQVRDVVLGRVGQHVGQVAAQNLDLADDPVAVERVDRHLGDVAPGGVDVGDAALVDARRPHRGHEAHALDDGPPGTAEVDGLAAGAPGGRDLDDGRDEAVAVQPEGECGAGDPGPADEDGAVLHRAGLSVRVDGDAPRVRCTRASHQRYCRPCAYELLAVLVQWGVRRWCAVVH